MQSTLPPMNSWLGKEITILRYLRLYFYTILSISGRENNTFWVFTAGGISGILSWIFTYPQDVIKSRIQVDQKKDEIVTLIQQCYFSKADKLQSEQRVYKGIMHCLKVSLQKEGYGILLRGIGSTIVR